MNAGADAADPLGQRPGVTRVMSAENGFDPAELGRTGPGIRDPAAARFQFDPKVPFDPNNRINNNSLDSHNSSLVHLNQILSV
jgi:hypothetical protein